MEIPIKIPVMTKSEVTTEAERQARVERWLEGGGPKSDRPSLAELEACGYRVMPAAFELVDAVTIAQRVGKEVVTIRKWAARGTNGFPRGHKVGPGRNSTRVWEWHSEVVPWAKAQGLLPEEER